MGSGTDDVALVRGTLARELAVAGEDGDAAWVARLRAALDSLRRCVEDGRADEVLPLAEDLVAALAEVADRDPGSGAGELAEEALAVHAAAARAAGVDRRRLAGWLVSLQLDHPEGPEVSLVEYAGVLGSEGLAEYRRRAEELCAELPTVPFGQPPRLDRRRWAVLRLVEELAEHTGDVDLQVAVLAKDLSTGWQYLRIATVLQEAGRSEEVLRWVERGLAATRGRGAAARLVDLAVDECLRQGWAERALGLLRTAFQRRPGLDTYLRLRAVAEPLDRWPRERAALAAALEWTDTPAAGGEPTRADLERGSALVRILLWEGDHEGAWRVAQERGCDEDTWSVLAHGRADTHPEQALTVYRRLVERRLAEPRAATEQVPELLDQLRVVADRSGRPDDFTHYLDEVKTRHAADRELLDALIQRGF
ncbi:hypothetical protein [Streptoalloteichus tenebrarius]|uniref:hypothetical protein n=1 Tax=Streptoalloteichus tenebrarius (strain ATCC 17920 / DSM 40477 / JCM 4838 / CBS 697.72 / NBRC 16177 / NCIMB 11028 / NRRL B-12390 / A12253. 1 / ISP 5477) TaxID=1933 RepID=UPI0035E6F6C1